MSSSVRGWGLGRSGARQPRSPGALRLCGRPRSGQGQGPKTRSGGSVLSRRNWVRLNPALTVATVLRERGVFLRSLTEGFDTSTASGRLLYHVLGAVAEFEREVIKERTVAGMKAAKKRGTHVGRPQALVGSRLAEGGRMLAAGKSQIETARILRVSRATIQRAYPGGSGRRAEANAAPRVLGG